MGNPLKWRNAAMIEWYGRQMTLFGHSNGEVTTYTYNADGIRTVKQHSDADGNVVGTTKYTLDGTKIIAEDRNGTKIYYTYDDKGSIMGMIYGGVSYVFSKNLQGDVIGIYNESGDLVAKYEYNAFGKITAITNANGVDVSANSTHIANINPIRYRGYYYDTETGLYYLQTRYYDPTVGRFLNADTFVATGQSILGNNPFIYCLNDPINRIDDGGNYSFKSFWKDVKKTYNKAVEFVGDAVEWVDDHVIQPVSNVIENVAVDISNYDFYNTDEEKVFESNYFSNYKGVPVIKTPFDASFSFGFIGLSKKQQTSDHLKHEYGHVKQLMRKGYTRYVGEVVIPSLLINLLDRLNKLTYNYYSYPFEAEANRLGGSSLTQPDKEPLPSGVYTSYPDLIPLFFD